MIDAEVSPDTRGRFHIKICIDGPVVLLGIARGYDTAEEAVEKVERIIGAVRPASGAKPEHVDLVVKRADGTGKTRMLR